MNILDPKEFASAFEQLEATDDPREIREAFERDQEAEDKHPVARYRYAIVRGEMVKRED